MKIARLTPFLWISPQIAGADLGALAAQGFRAERFRLEQSGKPG